MPDRAIILLSPAAGAYIKKVPSPYVPNALVVWEQFNPFDQAEMRCVVLAQPGGQFARVVGGGRAAGERAVSSPRRKDRLRHNARLVRAIDVKVGVRLVPAVACQCSQRCPCAAWCSPLSRGKGLPATHHITLSCDCPFVQQCRAHILQDPVETEGV